MLYALWLSCILCKIDGKNRVSCGERTKKIEKRTEFAFFLFLLLLLPSFFFFIPPEHGQFTQFTDSGRTQTFCTGQIDFGFANWISMKPYPVSDEWSAVSTITVRGKMTYKMGLIMRFASSSLENVLQTKRSWKHVFESSEITHTVFSF